MKWLASAPSNIALIKYMGKTDANSNLPSNASLSYTLESLRSFVELEVIEPGPAESESLKTQTETTQDQWLPLSGDSLLTIELSNKGKDRFLKFLGLLKQEFGVRENFIIRSANNFASDCGLASSASSFAALTKVACQAFFELGYLKEPLSQLEQASLSRRGSGSSCRSLVGPFAIWRQDEVQAVEFPLGQLDHMVVLVDSTKKEVSSSEAHRRVTSSELFKGRTERAETRLRNLISALREQNWSLAFELCWNEFWDMHALFETSIPSFGYMTPDSLKALRIIKGLWEKQNDGPLVTMDAGANIHLLFRRNQADLKKQWIQELSAFRIFESGKGTES